MSSIHWLSAFFWRQIVIHLATIGGGDEVTLVTVILGLLILLRGDQRGSELHMDATFSPLHSDPLFEARSRGCL